MKTDMQSYLLRVSVAGLLLVVAVQASVVVKVGKVDTMEHPFHLLPFSEIVARRFNRVEAFSSSDGEFMTYGTIVPYERMGRERTFVFPSRHLGLEGTNPFMASLALAFANHQRVALSPDMVWLLICQGLAIHVNLNGSEHAHRFTSKDDVERISVRHDGIAKGANDPKWAEVVSMFRDSLTTRIDTGVGRFFDRKFSTTGLAEEVAFRLTLMDAAKNFYRYFVATICGIPEFTIEGNKRDWKSIHDATRELDRFGLEWWTKELRPVLKQFVNAHDGVVDTVFWCSVLKAGGGSGQILRVNGWVAKFFPYILNSKNAYVRNPIMPDDYRGDLNSDKPRNHYSEALELACFSDGLLTTPFDWLYMSRVYRMQFVSGFVGSTFDRDTKTLRPEIGYIVTKAPRRAEDLYKRPKWPWRAKKGSARR